jgi:hypothetical protein
MFRFFLVFAALVGLGVAVFSWFWFQCVRSESANIEFQNAGFEYRISERFGRVFCFAGDFNEELTLADVPNARYLSSVDSIFYNGFTLSEQVWDEIGQSSVRTVIILPNTDTRAVTRNISIRVISAVDKL